MQNLPFPAGTAGVFGPEHIILLPFLNAVAEQIARHGPVGRPGDLPSAAEVHRVGMRVRALVAEVHIARAAEQLLAEPPMLAAFFANLDLLPAHGDPLADRIVAAVMRALEHADPAG